MRIEAAVLHQVGGPFVVEELDLQAPGPGEVLVRMAASGVCMSDWHLVTGDTRHPLPVVPGHEGSGVVEEVGAGVDHLAPGDPVVLCWAPSCGHCFYCLEGRPSLCGTYVEPIWAGTMLDGTTRLSRNGAPVYHFSGIATFAEATVVPAVSCVKIDRDVPLVSAALVGCAVTTGVGAVTRTVRVRPGDSVVVIGAGGVGLSIVQAARLVGAGEVIAVDRVPARAARARELGATRALGADEDQVAAVRAVTGGRGADWVFEAIGLPAVQEQALELVRPGGTLVLVGLSPMGSATNFPSALLTRQEKSVVGSYYGTAWAERDFPRYLGWARSGRLRLEEMVDRTYALGEINQAYADLRGEKVGRGVVVFDRDGGP